MDKLWLPLFFNVYIERDPSCCSKECSFSDQSGMIINRATSEAVFWLDSAQKIPVFDFIKISFVRHNMIRNCIGGGRKYP